MSSEVIRHTCAIQIRLLLLLLLLLLLCQLLSSMIHSCHICCTERHNRLNSSSFKNCSRKAKRDTM